MEAFAIIDIEAYTRVDRIKKFLGLKKVNAYVYSFDEENRKAIHIFLPYSPQIKEKQIAKDLKKTILQNGLSMGDMAVLTANAKKVMADRIFENYLIIPDGKTAFIKLLPQAIKRLIKQSKLDILDFTVLIYEKNISSKTVEIFLGLVPIVKYITILTENIIAAQMLTEELINDTGASVHVTNNFDVIKKCKIAIIVDNAEEYLAKAHRTRGQIIFNSSGKINLSNTYRCTIIDGYHILFKDCYKKLLNINLSQMCLIECLYDFRSDDKNKFPSVLGFKNSEKFISISKFAL